VAADKRIIAPYIRDAEALAKLYESRSFEEIHGDLIGLIPETPGVVLDIGAGSGRDAAWFARHGHEVVAVEPAGAMRQIARQLHDNPNIQWIDASLPELGSVRRLGLSYDIIWLSAVWMHVPPSERERAMRKSATLLSPGGRLFISLRHGPKPPDRIVYKVTAEEVSKLAQRYGLATIYQKRSSDHMNREDVWWESVVLELPDEGTGALPLLRHIILNDAKSSTYKLALLRALVRIADAGAGLVEYDDDGNVRLPLGLVALYWVRLFKPLVEKGYRQLPAAEREATLGFVKEPFHRLSNVSPYSLRVGMRFHGEGGKALRYSLRDAAQTIVKMPAFYTTYPGSREPVFPSQYGSLPRSDSFTIDRAFLWQFGELSVPAHLWKALTHFAVWIEPALINEWITLMQQYDGSRAVAYEHYLKALRWLDPEHDTALVRSLVKRGREAGEVVRCVWTGRPLCDNYAIDHCMPFARWPCNDLWNLLPTLANVNIRKRDRLPSAIALAKAHDRIVHWWDVGYRVDAQLAERFTNEVISTLPFVNDAQDLSSVFDGVTLIRTHLKQDQQLPEWSV